MRVRAAEGWLELGNVQEANGELDSLSPRLQAHPDVLEVRWQICARTGDWEKGLSLARELLRKAPDRASGWIDLSFALHELKMTQQAWDNLLAVAEKFPREPTISYNLACYAAQLGRSWEAEQWLKQTFKTGGAKEWKRRALEDRDLKPLWGKIEEM